LKKDFASQYSLVLVKKTHTALIKAIDS